MNNTFAQTLKNAKNKQLPVLGCFPLYPPVELFHSLGLLPVTLWGLAKEVDSLEMADQHVQNYACSVGRHLVEFVLSRPELLDGIFSSNACDTLRNLPEILEAGLREQDRSLPWFPLHVPQAPLDRPHAREYLKNNLETLVKEMEKAFHVSFDPDRFRQSVSLYNQARGLIAGLQISLARGMLALEEFVPAAMAFHHQPVEDFIQSAGSLLARPAKQAGGTAPKPVFLSGILAPPQNLCRVMDEAGLVVTGNDLAVFSRSLTAVADGWSDFQDYYQRLYFFHPPCTTLLQTSDLRLYQLLANVEKSGARGFVFVGEKFCEYEYFEWPILEQCLKEQGLQTLFLEISVDDGPGVESFNTRIQAFAEMME